MHGGVDAVFSALADERRRSLVEVLAERGSATATELAAGLPVTRQAVAKHLASLGEAGLVAMTRSGREVRYRLTPEPLDDAVALDRARRRELGRAARRPRAAPGRRPSLRRLN